MRSNNREKLKIVYVTSARLPTEKAHGLATVKICEAFAKNGYELDLVIPKLWRKKKEDIFIHYALEKNFNIVAIPCIDLIPLGFLEKFFFLIQSLSFSLAAYVFAFLKYYREKNRIIFFSHDYIPLYFATFLPGSVFYDIHHFPGDNFMYARVMSKSCGFAVQTKWKIKELEKVFGVSPERVVYWPNGTDVEIFNVRRSRKEVREMLGLSKDKKLAIYAGSTQSWKGVDTLEKVQNFLPKDTQVLIVSNRPHSEIPLYLKAADVLVLPNTAKQKVSMYYTSPMKLFEYMASGTPIVASDVPSIREILDDTDAYFAKPDDPASFGEMIARALEHSSGAEEKGKRAQEKSKCYTWSARARIILKHMQCACQI